MLSNNICVDLMVSGWMIESASGKNKIFGLFIPLAMATNTYHIICETYRRWTKYSNLEEKIGRHPLPQMSKLKNVCVICHAVGFDCFVHPSQPLEEDNNFEIWGARGISCPGFE